MKRKLLSIQQSTRLLAVVALSAAIAVGCSAQPTADPANQTAQEQVKTVKVAKIEKQKISEPIEQVGDVVSAIQLDVIPKASGEVVEILKKRGDAVNKGDVLFRLDPTDVQIQKDQNEISLRSAQEGLATAKINQDNNKADLQDKIATMETVVNDLEKDYNKIRNEYDQGIAEKHQVEQAETTLNNKRLELDGLHRQLDALNKTNPLESAETALDNAQVNSRSIARQLENLEVKAPATGILTDLTVEVGMTVQGGRVGEVQQINPVKIKAQLTEAAASLVRGKSELAFYIPGVTEKAKAPVTYLSNVINGATKAYDLEMEVPNPDGKLKPGSKAQIELTEEDEQIVPVVPTLSIVREGSDNFVYVMNGDIVEKRKVELGRLNETIQEIISGVKEGELLVVSGQHQLKDQEQVKVAN